MPRSTLDLIEELYLRCADLSTCALVIGYEEHSEFVFASQTQGDALEALNGHVAREGLPLGFIGYAPPRPGGSGSLLVQPLDEYHGEEWVEKMLLALVHRVQVLARQQSS